MNDQQTKIEEAIKMDLRRLEWMIPDAERRLNEVANQMLRRAERAVSDLAINPGYASWVDFAEGDMRSAREAKAEIEALYKQKKMLEYYLRKE